MIERELPLALVILAFQHRSVAEKDQPVRRPHLEMAEPELFVDEPDGLIDRYALVARHADIGQRQKLENAILDPPDGAQLIRSEERREGKEWISKCRSRWAPEY